MPDSLPAGLGGGSDPIGTAPPLASYEIPPSAGEKKAEQESDTARTEAVTQLKKASKETGDYLSHLADAPNPKDFGLSKDDLNALSPTKPPEYKSDNPIQDFGGMATLIGIFGGMMSRRPLVTSLNAASGAMTAYHQRNLEDYDQKVKEWKNNTDYISKVMDWREKAYDIADKQFSDNLAKWSAANTAIAAQTGDFDKIADLQQGNYENFYQKRRDAQAVRMQWQQHLDSMNEFAIRQRELLANPANAEEKDAMAIADGEIKKKEADNGKPLSDADKAQIRVDARAKAKAGVGAGTIPKLAGEAATLRAQANQLSDGDINKDVLIAKADAIDNAIAKSKGMETPGQLTDDAAKYTATRILAGDPTATVGLARSGANMSKIDNALTEMAKEKGIDAGKLLAAKLTVKADSASLTNMTKMTDAAVSYENTAQRNFQTALRLAPAAVPDLGPWINKWVETGETGLGNADVPAYVAAVMTGANEYAKIMNGSTGSQGSTVDSRREAAELFSPYLNTGQFKKVIEVAQQDMKNREGSLYSQIESIKQRIVQSGQPGEPPNPADNALNGSPKSALPSDLPPASGLPDGAIARDGSGKAVAKVIGGKWVAP